MATQATYTGPIKGALINGTVINWELDQYETNAAWLLAVLPIPTLATGDSLEITAMVGVVTEEPAILEVVLRNRIQRFYFTRTGGHADMQAGIVACSQADGSVNVYAVTTANFNKVNLSLNLGGGMPGVGGEGGGITIMAPPLYVGPTTTGTVVFSTLDETAYPPYITADLSSVSTATGFVTTGSVDGAPVGSMAMYFDDAGTGGNGSADIVVTGNESAGVPGFNLILQQSDGSNGHTYIRADSTPGTPRTLLPQDTEITGNLDVSANLTAEDAEFNTCEVDSSPVRTFANTPDAPPFNYPPAGVPQSTGNAWGASIDPTTLARTNAANIFTASQTIQGKVIATGTAPLDVSQSAATMGTGAGNTHPNLTLINSTAAANNKAWAMSVWPDAGQGPVLTFSLEDDSGNSDYWMAAWRAGITGTQVEIKPPLTVDGTFIANGTALIAGALTVQNQIAATFFNPTGIRAGTNPTISADEGAWALSLYGFARIVLTTNQGQIMNFGGSDGVTIQALRPINLPADPSQPLQAATKQYVDNKVVVGGFPPAGIAVSTGTAWDTSGNGTLPGSLTVDGNSTTYGSVYASSYFSNNGSIWIDGGGGNIYGAGLFLGGNNVHLDSGGNGTFIGTLTAGTKSFKIIHPLDQDKWLTHSCLEGPEIAVYYRGEGQTQSGKAEITLPDYFEALTRPEGRTVQLTIKVDDANPVFGGQIAAGSVKDGKFKVYSSDPSTAFYWEVKAVRADVEPLEVVTERLEVTAPIAKEKGV